MLQLKNISKSYGKIRALSPVDLTISTGETKVLVGPSGCGKSTLIRLIIGVIKKDSGEVYFDGELIRNDNLMEIRRKTGYVIQDGGLFPHLTVRENVTLLSEYIGWEEKRIEDRLHLLAELTHFPLEALQRFPLQLSGGQKQRVSLMRALMLDPKVLLLDEPLAALDPMIRADLQTELKEIFLSLRKAVVLVTHDINEAGFFADEVVLMRDGKIVQQATINEMINNPSDEFVSRFINAQRYRD